MKAYLTRCAELNDDATSDDNKHNNVMKPKKQSLKKEKENTKRR
jgi:hypothetical protein